MKKRLIALITVMLIVLSMAGCSSGKLDALKVLNNARKNCESAKNVESKALMNMGFLAAGQNVELKLNMDLAIFTEPYKAKVDVSMDLSGLGSQTTTSYFMEEDGKYFTYVNAAGTWYKQEMEAEKFKQTVNGYDSEAYISILAENADSFTIEEAEEDGKKLYKVEGTLAGDAMESMIEASGVKEQLASLGSDTSVYDDMGDMKVTLYVDKEKEVPYKITMDMKDIMTKALEASLSEAGSDEAVEVSNCTMEMIYTGFDTAEDFELPEEAKNASDLGAIAQ